MRDARHDIASTDQVIGSSKLIASCAWIIRTERIDLMYAVGGAVGTSCKKIIWSPLWKIYGTLDSV